MKQSNWDIISVLLVIFAIVVWFIYIKNCWKYILDFTTPITDVPVWCVSR